MSKYLYHGLPMGFGLIVGILLIVFFTLRNNRIDRTAAGQPSAGEVGLSALTSDKCWQQKLLPIKIMFFVLLSLEIIKIFSNILLFGNFIPQRYPIIYCSLILYAYPMICYMNNRFTEIAKAIAIIPSIFIGVFYLAVWSDVTDPGLYSFVMNFHSRFYHMCMLSIAFYMIINKMYAFRFRDFFSLFLSMGAYFLFCTVISLFIGENLSYFGPSSPITSILYTRTGYATGNLIIIMIIFVVSYIVYKTIYLVRVKFYRSKQDG